MNKLMTLVLLAAITQWVCMFAAGAATGTLATGAGYEYQAKKQMDKLDEDFKDERISRDEYLKRKQQIESGSIIY